MRSGDVSRKRLVLLTNEFPLNRGDAPFVANELNALRERFDEVVVLNYPSDGPGLMVDLPDGVTYAGSLKDGEGGGRLKYLAKPRVFWRAVATFWKEVQHGRVGRRWLPAARAVLAAIDRAEHPAMRAALCVPRSTTVSVYAFWAMGAGYAVATIPRVSGTVGVRLHRFDLYEDVIGWLPLRGNLLTRPDVLLPISDDGAHYLQQTYPWKDLAPVKVSRLGTFDHGPSPKRADNQPLTMVSVSAVSEVKRVDHILQTMVALSEQRAVRWIHFGDGALMPDLRSAAEGATTANLRIELRGHAENAAVMGFYEETSVDGFVNLSTSEGVPVSIMEAMSFGIPVVATDVGGTSEIVAESLGSGFTVPVDATPVEVAHVILRLMETELTPRAVWNAYSNAERNSADVAEVLSR